MQSVMVSHRELDWKMSFREIPKCNRGITYGGEDVSERKQALFMEDLTQAGIIRELQPQEHCFMSPVLFLRKGDSMGIRKVCDYRLLNSCSHTQGSPQEGVQSLIRKLPETWKVFCVIDLTNAFFNVPVDNELQSLFVFSAVGRRYTYKNLSQGWINSPALFQKHISEALACCN